MATKKSANVALAAAAAPPPPPPPAPVPDKVTIAQAIQRIVAQTYGKKLLPGDIHPEWHLHSPWPPIGMDDPTLGQMLGPLNAVIHTYKPANGVTQNELGDTDSVSDLMNLVWGKVK